MNSSRDLLHTVGQTLDGIKVAICLFDKEDKCIYWNKSFLQMFPEHAGNIYVGEHYSENLKRFYRERLSGDDLLHIDQHVQAGVVRHQAQMRPYSFKHRDRLIEVSSYPMRNGVRLRAWRSVVLSAENDKLSVENNIEGENTFSTEFMPTHGMANLLDRIPDGLMLCDEKGLIKWVNDPFTSLYGLNSKSDAIGCSLEMIFIQSWLNAEPDSQSFIRSGLVALRENLKYPGSFFELALPNQRYVRITSKQSETNENFYTHADISELKRQEKILIDTQTELFNQVLVRADEAEQLMLSSLNQIALTRDNETGNHIVRTQHYVKIIAQRLMEMGCFKDELDTQVIDLLFKAAPLHDVGKVGIPDYILKKPGKLISEEWEIMKSHTLIGESALSAAQSRSNASISVMSVAIEIAGCHHEKWDGSGYPRGYAGKEIPLSARIMALADVYDALVSERVYKNSWTHDQAVAAIIEKRGTHFDPFVVDAFMFETSQFQQVAATYAD